MKILIVTEYFPKNNITGGVEARAYYLSKHLAKNHEVSVICSRQKGQPRESEINDCKIYRVGREHAYSPKGSFISRLSFVRSARKKGEELDFDIVDGQSFLSYIPAYRIGEKLGKKKVATYHETWLGDWIKNKGITTGIVGELWERMALDREWDRIISVSEFTKKRLIERGLDPKSIDVVPNGVELSEFEKIKVEKSDKPTVCTVSRLTKEKQVDMVVKAFEKVSQKIPEAQLRVIGDGPEFDEIKKLSQSLDANIGLWGYVPDKKDVIKITKSSQLLVSASTLEGFGITLIESAASKTPFVASNIEPHIEVTKRGKGGLIFVKNDMEDLTRKILKILGNEELYEKKRKECIKLAQEYDWKKIARRIEKIYQNLL